MDTFGLVMDTLGPALDTLSPVWTPRGSNTGPIEQNSVTVFFAFLSQKSALWTHPLPTHLTPKPCFESTREASGNQARTKIGLKVLQKQAKADAPSTVAPSTVKHLATKPARK